MHDFVIVGGGIGGAVLARLLAQAGRRVLVLERDPAPRRHVRPEVLWPATVETLRPLLAALPPDAWMRPLAGIRALLREQPLFELDEDAFRRAAVVMTSTDPNLTRETLLRDPPFELCRGVEVVELLREGGRVAGVRAKRADGVSDLPARWVVGDDGPGSRVREACGISIRTAPLRLDLACAEFAWPERLPAGVVHLWVNPRRGASGVLAVGAAPLPGERGMLLVPIRSARADVGQAIDEALVQFAADEPALGELLEGRRYPADFARFRPRYGHAQRYGVPGAVLLGDAAHPVTPAGGQGANMSVADAVALARCVQEGEGDLVERHERTRRAANARSIAISRSVSRFWALPAPLADWALPRVLRWAGRRPQRMQRVLRRMATAFAGDAAGG